MAAPGAAGASFDVLLQFSLDEEAQKRIESGVSSISDELKLVQKRALDAGKAINDGFKGSTESVKQTDEALKKTGKTAQETARQVGVQIRNLRSEARAIIADVRLLRDQADDLDRVAKPLFAGGAIITGGIFALANSYVKDATQATETTREWKAAQDDLNRSGQRIGEVLATKALPILRDAANFTRQIAGVLDAHPEIAAVAVNAGLMALALGTIGKAVSSGIRLYADLKLDRAMLLQQSAAQLQLQASENQLRAAGLQAEASGVSRSPTTGGGAGLGAVVLTTTSVIIGAELGAALGNKIGEAATGGKTGLAGPGGFGIGDAAVAGLAASQTPSFLLLQGLNKLGVVSDDTVERMRTNLTEFDRLAAGVLGANKILNVFNNLSPEKIRQSLEARPSFLGGSSENQDQLVQAFSDFRSDTSQIEQDAMDERKQIIADGERAIADITRNFVSQRTGIERQFSQAAAQLTSRFQEDVRQAELDYQNERAQVAQDGNERIREILQEEQDKREEIEREFAKASSSAAADRDALALVQAQEARDEALEEAGRGTQEAIAKERRETQERLAELAARYAQERQQRQAQYEADLKDNAARRAAALKEAQERYAAELKQAREANALKLREAAEAANRERIERRTQFIAQLQDLGVTLNSERQLRNNSYNAMLNDLRNFIQQAGGAFTVDIAGATASGGTAGSTTTLNPNSGFSGSGMFGTHDFSGYANKGIYRMAQDGRPEWVMGGADTQAAERAMGGQLTQANMAQMIALAAAARGAGTLVDNTTYGKDMTTRQIRDIKIETNRAFEKMLGGY